MFRPTRRTAFFATALWLSAPLVAQQTEPVADGDPDRLPPSWSQPSDHVASGAMAPQDPTPRDDGFNAPYGTGFEARQRGQGGRGIGGHDGSAEGSFGGRGGFVGGRGGGRGR